jgi:hypothetical protein
MRQATHPQGERSKLPLRALFGGCIAIAATLLLGYAVAQANGSPSSRNANVAPNPLAAQHGKPDHQTPQGMPAIHVQAALVTSTGPHFTEADVVQYIATTPIPYAVRSAPAPQVVSVQFLTMQQLSGQLPQYNPASTGISANTLLCLVRVSGTFSADPPLGAKAAYAYGAYLLFDAHTGNLLSITFK